jgi:hypothetical protein
MLIFQLTWELYKKMTNNNSDNENSDGDIYEATSSPQGVSRDEKALLKFGEEQFLGSIDTIKNFSQTMITLDSGLFAVYFALLEFLGIKDITTVGTKIATYYVTLPPMLIIFSIIAFIFAILPIFVKMRLDFPDDISNIREKVLKIKFASAICGIAFLVAAMAISVDIFLKS